MSKGFDCITREQRGDVVDVAKTNLEGSAEKREVFDPHQNHCRDFDSSVSVCETGANAHLLWQGEFELCSEVHRC